ncbi:MAG: hypothetical protein GYA55_02515 [SAR324 cluster bacterium]|uniref:Uncharacterized protein n=1 Tax=SAR324 cluster bacterium TaxID=2024889 RepID=A0A7X9IJE0_9DELT|nr:hypothetical protein [SAR324 cluster bacterium]
MSDPSPNKKAEWAARAARKKAIVPEYFEVSPHKVIIHCGSCGHIFTRTLILRLDEPVFVCPLPHCKARNWVPVTFDLK